METTTHTLSPWNIQSGKVYGGGMLVATLDPPQLQEEIAMKAADARLIAAAPDLLAALDGMLDQFEDNEQYCDDDAAVIATAREAIAQATGGEA